MNDKYSLLTHILDIEILDIEMQSNPQDRCFCEQLSEIYLFDIGPNSSRIGRTKATSPNRWVRSQVKGSPRWQEESPRNHEPNENVAPTPAISQTTDK